MAALLVVMMILPLMFTGLNARAEEPEKHMIPYPEDYPEEEEDITIIGVYDAVGDEIVKEQGGFIIVRRVYRGVYLTPRKMSDAVTAGAVIESFLNKITEDGEVKAMSYDELKSVIVDNFTELKDSAYDLVASVMRISEEEAEWMLPMNAVENAIHIATNNPALVNESNFFFEPSLDRA